MRNGRFASPHSEHILFLKEESFNDNQHRFSVHRLFLQILLALLRLFSKAVRFFNPNLGFSDMLVNDSMSI